MLETIQPWPTPVTLIRKPSTLHQNHRKTQSPSTPYTPATDTTLHLPRILCLHGGGTNARIFQSQCRALRARLGPYFRLVFAEAPFYTTPGPDVVSVYEKWGPFKAWFPPGYAVGSPQDGPVPISSSPVASKIVLDSIEQSIQAAMDESNRAGGRGPWIGLLGFSQGAKMAASLLLRQQNDMHMNQCKRVSEADYRFAILIAGRAPLVELCLQNEFSSPGFDVGDYGTALHLPTIHVHGLKDPGISLHRDLLNNGCEYGSARLVEWDGEHRVPIRTPDVMAVVDATLDIARDTGVIGWLS